MSSNSLIIPIAFRETQIIITAMKLAPMLWVPAVLFFSACATTPDLQRQGPEALVASADYQLSVGNFVLAERRAAYGYSDAEKAGNEKAMGEALIVLAKIDRLTAGEMLERKKWKDAQGSGNALAVVRAETPDPAEIEMRFRRAIDKVTEAIEHLKKAGAHDSLSLAYAERGFSHSALGEKDAACADYDAALAEYDLAFAANPALTYPIYSAHGKMTFPEMIRYYREMEGRKDAPAEAK